METSDSALCNLLKLLDKMLRTKKVTALQLSFSCYLTCLWALLQWLSAMHFINLGAWSKIFCHV